MSAAAIRVGFFGKLPSRGDFVRAALSRSFVQAWDRWLEPLLPAAQDRMGEAWTDVWRATRPWRFAMPAGLCCAWPVSGVWLASTDKVGRCFPLTIAAEAATGDSFLDAAEDLGREAIESDMTPGALAGRLSCLPRPCSSTAADPTAMRWWRRLTGEPEVIRGDRLPDLDVFIGMLTA